MICKAEYVYEVYVGKVYMSLFVNLASLSAAMIAWICLAMLRIG